MEEERSDTSRLPDYIALPNGNIISPHSDPGLGSPNASLHMRTMLVGYNPNHYGYTKPIPLNKPFRSWDRLWEVKQSSLGSYAGYGLFAAEDIILTETVAGIRPHVYLFPISGPLYRRKDWDMVVHQWPRIKSYSLLSNLNSLTHYTHGLYIDATPAYSWCIGAYINSGIHNPRTCNVEWEESYVRDERLHPDTTLPNVWTLATRTILAGEELFAHYPIMRS